MNDNNLDMQTNTSNDTETFTAPAPAPRKRGFAAMDPALVREISRKGGRAAHAAGTAHEFTSDEAKVAGSKGGKVTHARLAAAKRGQEVKP